MIGNVLGNDTVDGATANSTTVTPSVVDDGGLTGVSIASNGDISVPAGAVSGTYTITYKICEVANPNNCSSASITITVDGDADGDGVLDSVDICNGFDDSLDNDGDGVPDGCDDDDDNDGILDSVECPEGDIRWTHDGQNDGPTYNGTNFSTYFTGSNNTTFGSGLTEVNDNPDTYFLTGANASNFAEAKTNNDYVQHVFTPSRKLQFREITLGFYTQSTSSNEANKGNFKVAAEISSASGFGSPTLIFENTQIDDLSPGYTTFKNGVNLTLEAGTEYTVRFYLYDERNTDANDRVRWDDVFMGMSEFNDADGDGTIDCFETDSDDDGCPDTIEAGHTESTTNAGQVAGTGFDTNNGRVTGFATAYTGTNSNVTTAGTPANVSSQPGNQSVLVGGTVSFTVATDGNILQWELFSEILK
mgnify:CR=1 FL=1